MKTILLNVAMFIVAVNCYAQITFEKGYFINNSGARVECLIRNIDWNVNPTEFIYKLTPKSEKKVNGIDAIKEFGIYNASKYISSNVKIDKSKTSINDLYYDRRPKFSIEKLFLKVLVEGETNLFSYKKGGLKVFFISKTKENLETLIFKSYKSESGSVRQNNRFKQQLSNYLQCKSINKNLLENLTYTEKSLVNIFINYNKCINPKYNDNINKKKNTKNSIHLSLKLGLGLNSLNINNVSSLRNIDFNQKTTGRFGLELEYTLPFNKNKWGLSIEPTYQYFDTQTQYTIPTNLPNIEVKSTATVNYSSIEVPIALKHYLFLNKNEQLFFNVGFIIDFALNKKIETKIENSNVTNKLDIEPASNFVIGVGYKYKRYTMSLKYQTNREILNKYIYWKSNYQQLYLTFGYKLF